MKSPFVTILRCTLPITAACLAWPVAATQLDANEFARCAAIAGSTERLACYDALAASASPGTAAAPAATAPPMASVAPVAQTTPAAPASAGQMAPVASAANPDDPANFGLTKRQLKVISGGPDSVKAIVSQMTQDRLNNVALLLDNGQTWTFVESDPRLRPGDTVTIKRAALGSFLMVTPSRHSYRVQRLK